MKQPTSAVARSNRSEGANRNGPQDGGPGEPTPTVGRESLYDLDFVEWTRHTAELMRQHRFDELDIEQAAEEMEDMGKRDIRELFSRTEVLLAHLLKWKCQPGRRSRSWRATIRAQRSDIARLLGQSPSLRQRLATELHEAYRAAVKLAADESGLRRERFPSSCPFSADEILSDEFLPS